ncbi:MAG: gamma-glutamyltransferase, partial [Gemmatimonadales bacterium]
MQFRATGVVLACVVSAMACARPVPVPAPERAAALINPAWPYMGKARVAEGDSAMVVSGNRLASEVGRDILRQGGNAVDAAVAVGMALAVVHPEAGNIGGGGFMIFHMKDGRHYALDYREAAPGAASRDMYLDKDGNPTDASLVGHLAVGVPGAVAGMAEAHRRFGRLPWSQVVEPAVRLARDGFTVDDYRHRSLAGRGRLLGRFASSRRYFLPGGKAPAVGTRFVQADLARTLAAIRDSGPAGFYRGWVADSLAGEMRRGGGIITLKDLAGYHALWRDPIQIRYRGYTIYSMPPASSGGVTMAEILNIMEGYDPLPPFGSARLVHLETEAMRRAFTDRNVFLGDPDFVQMPLDRLLSKEYADSLRGTILPDRASPTRAFDPSIRTGSSTTHYSVVDAEGNAVSCTTTLNNSYGSGVAVRGAGFLLNDEMDDFATAPGRPNFYGLVQGEANAVAPGKRMLSAMTPSIVLDRNGRLLMVVGTPGGPTIITQVYHVI